jgi:hypothetical protein
MYDDGAGFLSARGSISLNTTSRHRQKSDLSPQYRRSSWGTLVWRCRRGRHDRLRDVEGCKVLPVGHELPAAEALEHAVAVMRSRLVAQPVVFLVVADLDGPGAALE